MKHNDKSLDWLCFHEILVYLLSLNAHRLPYTLPHLEVYTLPHLFYFYNDKMQPLQEHLHLQATRVASLYVLLMLCKKNFHHCFVSKKVDISHHYFLKTLAPLHTKTLLYRSHYLGQTPYILHYLQDIWRLQRLLHFLYALHIHYPIHTGDAL